MIGELYSSIKKKDRWAPPPTRASFTRTHVCAPLLGFLVRVVFEETRRLSRRVVPSRDESPVPVHLPCEAGSPARRAPQLERFLLTLGSARSVFTIYLFFISKFTLHDLKELANAFRWLLLFIFHAVTESRPPIGYH